MDLLFLVETSSDLKEHVEILQWLFWENSLLCGPEAHPSLSPRSHCYPALWCAISGHTQPRSPTGVPPPPPKSSLVLCCSSRLTGEKPGSGGSLPSHPAGLHGLREQSWGHGEVAARQVLARMSRNDVHSLTQYFPNVSCVPGSVLGSEGASLNKTGKNMYATK